MEKLFYTVLGLTIIGIILTGIGLAVVVIHFVGKLW